MDFLSVILISSIEVEAGVETELTDYGRPLTSVPPLKYLGQVLSASSDDWAEVVHNLRKARSKWAWLSRVLGREGADARMLGMFYVAVVQAVLLYRLEMWVMYPRIGKTLVGFHHWMARRLIGRKPKRRLDGTWDYPPLAEAMAEAGIRIFV